ncbi:DNA-binding protein [Cereibacter changlensis JA139]|uniref:DNA-binding protein n=2 Tax=Cereibacter changlensis TaxID=402884 RepID=A0A2T4JPK5_9RHOB|nr:DNA-binding protein [Cereibacter changlensis]PTE19849.1 DNA-binding protein [Cereibacter changlensis JA139]PZX49986.1 hypothetical protein LX76_03593 [Cereibacter changlensis]
MKKLVWNAGDGALCRQAERAAGWLAFDPWRLTWSPMTAPPAGGQEVSPGDALRLLAAGPRLRRVPVAVIGPREATARQLDTAELLGREMARHGLQLLSGGKSGVMEAVSRGNLAAGGLPVGLIPDDEWHEANDFVAIPLASGIGPARNAIIARAGLALVAVGGGVGTISEMALGIQFGRLVLALDDAPEVPQVIRLSSVAEALDAIAGRILGV